jgi:hypothetical protein
MLGPKAVGMKLTVPMPRARFLVSKRPRVRQVPDLLPASPVSQVYCFAQTHFSRAKVQYAEINSTVSMILNNPITLVIRTSMETWNLKLACLIHKHIFLIRFSVMQLRLLKTITLSDHIWFFTRFDSTPVLVKIDHWCWHRFASCCMWLK